MFAFVVIWAILIAFFFNAGYGRIACSMLCPILAPFFLLDWSYRKWHGQPTTGVDPPHH